jgi:peptide/nickel transport system substrate-binding protein
VGNTTQAAEADWLAYTGLVTYSHQFGLGGGMLIPGLAAALPIVSNGGTTYKVTLRKGLAYSNGTPVKASDFAWTVERALRIPWSGSGQYIGATIKGAFDFQKGKAKAISGITTNDATGDITVQLTSPYGAFENVLAFPALGLVPSGTPMRNEPNRPPPGVGPYMITKVVRNASFSLIRNPNWSQLNIPGIRAGNVNIDVKISSNIRANAEAVLQSSADVFDWADTIPRGLVSQIQSRAADRYSRRSDFSLAYYIFMNTQARPFSSKLARQAVVSGLDENAMSRLGSGSLIEGCFFLPPSMSGHPSSSCPYGDPASGGDLTLARALVKRSGMAGMPVTVWSETRSPQRQWMTYYTRFLNTIGFRATQKVVADTAYIATIGDPKRNPQTGFAEHSQHFPNPIDFYSSLRGTAIHSSNNSNFGQVSDPKIDTESTNLGTVPAGNLGAVASQWQALDEYVARKAYVAVFGYQTFPAFTSSRIDLSSATFHPVYGWDWSSFKLK